jgi:carbamoyltransferase
MTQWIAGITRGHNAGVCLLKDGEIVFALEEERLSRQKYDGGPFATMVKILEYTDRLDYLVIAHTAVSRSWTS